MGEILNKYKIKQEEDNIKSSDVYDWKATKDSEFTKELKAMAREIIGKEIKITWWRIFEITLIFLLALW